LLRALVHAEGKLFLLACCLAGAVLAAVFFASGGFIIGAVGSLYDRAEKVVRSLTIFEVGVACAGLVVGLAISFFITLPLSKLNWVGVVLTICVNFLFGYIGLAIAVWKCRDIAGTFRRGGAGAVPGQIGAAYAGAGIGALAGVGYGAGHGAGHGSGGAWDGSPKLLDTSAIIDGRIADIVRTGFLEGPLIVPEFVLAELRHIADSADALKRGKGRRGLDVLSAIQTEMDRQLTIEKLALPEGAEVDAELVSIAQKNGYTILTTDYNLNKVASVQGVRVLNINELNNAIKPVAVPGEIIAAQIVKEGKEPGQGVAYMPDGTMVVVEGARSRVGETMAVVLTSVLQTAAGRMIFAKPKTDGNGNGGGAGNGNGGGAGGSGGSWGNGVAGGGNGNGAGNGGNGGTGNGNGNGGGASGNSGNWGNGNGGAGKYASGGAVASGQGTGNGHGTGNRGSGAGGGNGYGAGNGGNGIAGSSNGNGGASGSGANGSYGMGGGSNVNGAGNSAVAGGIGNAGGGGGS
jgi:uncharacterized protein YacL